MLDRVEVKLSTADLDQTKLFIRAAIEWQKLLVHFDNAHTEQTPRGLVWILEKLLVAHDITGSKCRLIAAPAAEYNYRITNLAPLILDPVKDLFILAEETGSEKDFFKFFSDPLFVITFPRMERDNILAHAVFGHEVGHLVAARCIADPTMLALIKDPMNGIRDDLRAKSTAQSPAVKTVEAAKEFHHIRSCWLRGMEELISDYVGLLLFGPSALFAFYWVTSHRDLDKLPSEPGFYPAARHRLRFALKTLEEEGFVDALRSSPPASGGKLDCYPSVAAFIDFLQTLAKNDADEVAMRERKHLGMQKAYDLMGITIEHAKKLAKQNVQALTYSRDSLQSEVPELVERISFDIPPDEIGVGATKKSPTWASAILAGWCWAIHGQKAVGGVSEPLTAKQRELLNTITLRGVESILMKQLYDEEKPNR